MHLCQANINKIKQTYAKQKGQQLTQTTDSHYTDDNQSSTDQSQCKTQIFMPTPIYPINYQKDQNDYFYNLFVSQTLNHMYKSFKNNNTSNFNYINDEVVKEQIYQQVPMKLSLFESIDSQMTTDQDYKLLRKQKVQNYLEKKKTRKWNVLRYEVRKKIAKTRHRVKGRFIKEDLIPSEPKIKQESEEIII